MYYSFEISKKFILHPPEVYQTFTYSKGYTISVCLAISEARDQRKVVSNFWLDKFMNSIGIGHDIKNVHMKQNMETKVFNFQTYMYFLA